MREPRAYRWQFIFRVQVWLEWKPTLLNVAMRAHFKIECTFECMRITHQPIRPLRTFLSVRCALRLLRSNNINDYFKKSFALLWMLWYWEQCVMNSLLELNTIPSAYALIEKFYLDMAADSFWFFNNTSFATIWRAINVFVVILKSN